jgi:hypothetical protein
MPAFSATFIDERGRRRRGCRRQRGNEHPVGDDPGFQQAFQYDEAGNLVSDGLWRYQWDAENRLVGMTTLAEAVSVGVANQKLSFRYDHLGRRIQKRVQNLTTGRVMPAGGISTMAGISWPNSRLRRPSAACWSGVIPGAWI